MRLGGWRLIADRRDSLEHALGLVTRRLGGFLLDIWLRSRRPGCPVLLAVGFGAKLRALPGGARRPLALPATTAATAASTPRSLAGLRAAFVPLVGGSKLRTGSFGHALLALILVVMIARLGMSVRMGVGHGLAFGPALWTAPPAPSPP